MPTNIIKGSRVCIIEKSEQPHYFGVVISQRNEGTLTCVAWDNPFIGITNVPTSMLQDVTECPTGAVAEKSAL